MRIHILMFILNLCYQKREKEDFIKERNACVIGADIAKQYNLKIGDQMTIEGDIYPGRWDFVIRGIYKPRDKTTDGTQMLFHWDYVNERMKEESPGRANHVGWYIEKIDDPDKSGEISAKIDALLKIQRRKQKLKLKELFNRDFLHQQVL